MPNSTVKRSHGVNVHNLIQKIENHPLRHALQCDLQQHRQFNPFSKESRDVIKAVGNTELCELLDVEPKVQRKVCLAHWDAGIVYCTCGHFLRDDTTENKKYIKSVLDLLSIPNFYIRKGRPHCHTYGKKEGAREYHTANQLQKKCRKRRYSHGPRLYVCQAPNAFICVSGVAPSPSQTPNAFICVSPNAFICVSPNAFTRVSPNASAESATELASLARFFNSLNWNSRLKSILV